MLAFGMAGAGFEPALKKLIASCSATESPCRKSRCLFKSYGAFHSVRGCLRRTAAPDGANDPKIICCKHLSLLIISRRCVYVDKAQISPNLFRNNLRCQRLLQDTVITGPHEADTSS